jgi:TetR/AcrR family transcriptional repressor of the ameABC operon
MARPQSDIEAGRQDLLNAVEELIRQRGAVDISLVELAGVTGMSPSNIYRFFENKEALFEAVAESWFADKVAIMEEVVGSSLPIRDKMYAYFARRFTRNRERFEAEPELFKSYCELGTQHFEVVRGYVDLGDHYLAVLVVEAQDQGYFKGLSIDQTVSLINQMVHVYCNPDMLIYMAPKLSEAKLASVIDAIFAGLNGGAQLRDEPVLQAVS